MRRRHLCWLFALLAPLSANAATEARETYALSIAGFEIGEAVLEVTSDEARYSATVDGGYRFLFWSGAATVESQGVRDGGAFSPRLYRSRLVSSTREVTTQIDFDRAGVTLAKFTVEPPFDPEEFGDRVPVAESDLKGAFDPLTAFLIPAGSRESACQGLLQIFSGLVRFDVKLTDQQSPRAACRTEYRPISGHRRVSREVDRLRDDGLQISLFEILPGVWAPHRLGFVTRFGTLALERRTE